MENLNAKVGRILANDWEKAQLINPYAINNPQELELKPKTDAISVKFEFEKYENPIAEIVGDEVVVKVGKFKVGGVK